MLWQVEKKGTNKEKHTGLMLHKHQTSVHCDSLFTKRCCLPQCSSDTWLAIILINIIHIANSDACFCRRKERLRLEGFRGISCLSPFNSSVKWVAGTTFSALGRCFFFFRFVSKHPRSKYHRTYRQQKLKALTGRRKYDPTSRSWDVV